MGRPNGTHVCNNWHVVARTRTGIAPVIGGDSGGDSGGDVGGGSGDGPLRIAGGRPA